VIFTQLPPNNTNSSFLDTSIFFGILFSTAGNSCSKLRVRFCVSYKYMTHFMYKWLTLCKTDKTISLRHLETNKVRNNTLNSIYLYHLHGPPKQKTAYSEKCL
jgi:hypothetical protein